LTDATILQVQQQWFRSRSRRPPPCVDSCRGSVALLVLQNRRRPCLLLLRMGVLSRVSKK
ncbi:unnamed protein product, partial [Symbiodinium pilosum]